MTGASKALPATLFMLLPESGCTSLPIGMQQGQWQKAEGKAYFACSEQEDPNKLIFPVQRKPDASD